MSSALSERDRRQQYYCSREWGLLKEAVRKRCGGTCERCHNAPMYAVHHLTYVRLYREHLEDLQGVCDPCHEFLHGKDGGKGRDPVLDAPVKLCGREIGTVYLAGRISGGRGNWRSEILPGWRVGEAKSTSAVSDVKDLGDIENHDAGNLNVPIPDGRVIGYSGPFWLDVWSGHGGGLGPHAFANEWQDSQSHGISEASICSPGYFAQMLIRLATKADLVFAWLEDRECIGTIAEIGATAFTSIVVVATPKWDRELWFPCALADRFVIAESAGKAWEWLWKNPAKSCRLGAVRDSCGPAEGDL